MSSYIWPGPPWHPMGPRVGRPNPLAHAEQREPLDAETQQKLTSLRDHYDPEMQQFTPEETERLRFLKALREHQGIGGDGYDNPTQ